MNKESALLLEQHFETALESSDGIKKLSAKKYERYVRRFRRKTQIKRKMK